MMDYVEVLLPTVMNAAAVVMSGAAIIICLRTFALNREAEEIIAETRRMLDEMESDR